MADLHISVIIGSTRPNRFSEKPAKWIFELLQKQEGVKAELLDLRDYPMPFYNEPMSPSRLEGKYSDPVAMKWVAKVAQADGFIIVSPEYNHGTSAVLKNALDYPYQEWNNKAVGFISYGGVGGARAIEQLRLVAVELQMAPIELALGISGPAYMAIRKDEPGGFETIQEKADKFIAQLLWWTKALKAAREAKTK